MIRYNRTGRRNHAHFRVVVQEHTAAPGGRHVAIVGSYNPHTKEAQLKKDEITKWLSQGAQATDSVWNLLVKEGVVKGEKRKIKLRAKKSKGEGEEGADGEAPAADAAEGDAKAAEEKTDEAPAEEKKEESKEEAPAEEKKEDAPAAEKK